MPPDTNKKLIHYVNERSLVGKPAFQQVVSPHISFDPEFSLPEGFFKNDFLDNCDIGESPVKEAINPKKPVE